MRKTFLSAIFFVASAVSFGQATNPQNTFANAVNANRPSLWLNFNDATPSFRDSVSGTLMGAGTASPNGQSITGLFNGINNYLASASASTFTPPAISENAWINFSSLPGAYNSIVNATGTGAQGTQWYVQSNGQMAVFALATGGTVAVTSGATLSANTWYFVSFAYDSVNGLKVYLNGSLYGSAAANGTIAGTTYPMYIGYLSSALPRYWKGQISNVTIYNTPLTSTQINTLYTGGTISGGLIGQWQIDEGTGTTAADSSVGSHNMTWSGTASGNTGYYDRLVSAGTVLQPGFDNTNNANYSAKFGWNQWNVAPNLTLGSTMEWNTPWTMLLHVNKFNWDHASKIILASKGDLNSAGVINNNWQLFVQQNSGNSVASQLCFSRNGAAPYTLPNGPTFGASQQWCSPAVIDAMPNNFNYDIVVEDNGTGGGSAISMWINGSAQSSLVTSFGGRAFGSVTIAIANGGTGYTSSPAISSTGGGANCVIAGGTATIVSGAITAVNFASSGCTSAPTITATGGGGSGAVLTATSYPMRMNSPTQPLMVPGFVSGGVLYGPGGTDTAENPMYIDEFAEFPGNLSFGQITNIFYETKFYQGLVYPGLSANPPLVIFNSSGCGPDFSGDQTVAMLLGAHQAGLLRLIGVDDDDGNAVGSNSAAWFRQMLDQAGLADVPVSIGVGSYDPNIGGCPPAHLAAYNADTAQDPARYQTASTMYRTLFAKYPNTPIYVLMTQTANGYNNFQLSAPDSISPLTGLQLQAQNYANGGWVNAFEGNFYTTPSNYTSLLDNLVAYPIYFEGGSPAPGGPGILVSRTALDPIYQSATLMINDAAQGWTNLNVAQLISPYFLGGVQIALSGGTGYASNTAITAVGGGPGCIVTGYMLATGGVPSSIVTPWYANVPATYDGLGYGCSPAVFTATGSGTNLTVSAITCCNIGPYNLTPPKITVGDTISGAGIPTGTTIVSQISGTPGGVGVYVTSAATTALGATVTRTPTVSLTAPTGTGVTLTVTNGIFVKNYGGTGTASYAVWPNMWNIPPLFSWFQNSLIDPNTVSPRSY